MKFNKSGKATLVSAQCETVTLTVPISASSIFYCWTTIPRWTIMLRWSYLTWVFCNLSVTCIWENNNYNFAGKGLRFATVFKMTKWALAPLLGFILFCVDVEGFAGSVTNLNATRTSSNIQVYPLQVQMKEQRSRISEPKGSSNRMDNNIECNTDKASCLLYRDSSKGRCKCTG